MQQEQGFANDNQIELVEVNYIPIFSAKPHKTKTYNPTLKLTTTSPHQEASIFINPTLEHQLQQSFRSKYPSNIVYQSGAQLPPSPPSLIFDSNFENGNLEYVISQDHKHYDLFIKADTNTKLHFQWFRFKVKNKQIKQATFTLKNLLKPNMLYQQGLRPYFKSTHTHSHYQQLNKEVTYRPADDQEDSIFYQLHFSFEFERNHDQVEFCSQPPYTPERISRIFRNTPFSKINISKTVTGRQIEAYIANEHLNYHTVVVALARQHPGESVGSWIIEGLANKLVELPSADIMWILVPMVNVDGVIAGNNRSGLLGYDFNRHWYIDKDTNRSHLFPEIMGIINYFKKRQKEFSKKTKIFLDFHGHSSAPNVFAYGPPHHKTSQYYHLSRVLPFLIHSKTPDFSYKQSHYEVSPTKKYCARSVFFERLGFQFSYTIESSFGIYNNRRINQTDLLKMGEAIGEATHEFASLVKQHKKHKLEGNLDELLNIIKTFNQNENKPLCDDSDSEEEQKCPERTEFEQKMTKLLSARSEGKDIILNSTESEKPKTILQNQKQLCNSISKSSGLRYRFKTQHSKLKQTTAARQSSLFLPRLKPRSRQKAHESERSSVLDMSFDNLSLTEIKQKLHCIRNSKLGKKLLINRF